MTRTVYINGRFCAPEDATVSIFDRGLLFADAIYEVAGVIDGKLLDFAAHMRRLDLSLVKMAMVCPLNHNDILWLMRELLRLNKVDEGLVYIQITRGSAGDRDFLPASGLRPTIFAFAQAKTEATRREIRDGIVMRTAPDIRWGRRDIKTTGLMGSVFAKQEAAKWGAAEALLQQNGYVTEGAATSFFIVVGNTIITRPLSNDILHGCTRKALLTLIEGGDVKLQERLFTVAEAMAADEAFITGASTFVCPVLQIDDVVLKRGVPGSITRRLQDLYLAFARRDAI